MIYNSRMTAEMEDDFVVFLIGMRINTLWKFWKWLPVLQAMGPMIKELSMNPDSGFLSSEFGFGRTFLIVQYWKSTDHLIQYAKDREAKHLPAWAAFNRSIGTAGDVGIWHETYQVAKGGYESVYVNMPKFGLGRAGNHVEVKSGRHSANGRLGKGEEPSPV